MSERPSLEILVPGLLGPLAHQPRAGELLADVDTGVLDRLLARARRRSPAESDRRLERLLFDAFGVPAAAGAECPVAALTRQMDAGDAGHDTHLRADPVHLRAGMSEVLLLHACRAPGLSLDAGETAALCRAVNEALAEEGLTLEPLAPGRWYLRLPAPPAACFCSPYDLAGGSLRERLPSGEEGARWRRLLNLTQTALFAAPVNAAREAAGRAPVNSLWFFGAGRLPPPPDRRFDGVWAGHELALALAAHGGMRVEAPPGDAAAWLAQADAGRHLLLVEDCADACAGADASAWVAALEDLQARWLAPLATALRTGRLRSLSLRCEDGCWQLGRAAMWRVWRRGGLLSAAAG